MICESEDKIFSIEQPDFEQLALEIFQFQYNNNAIYQQYVNAVSTVGPNITSVAQIPFLPIQFFKTARVTSTAFEPETVFESSGTTQTVNSRHYVKKLNLYRQSFLKAWELFYGPVQEWCVIALLPAYLERQHSSLVLMADELIKLSGCADSGFYLYEHEKLAQVLQQLEQRKQKTVLIGVTFALLDFAEKYPMPLQHTIIMETGGMKGRRKEMTREEVHAVLTAAFQQPAIHSEYGMTELLSQAYSAGNGLFACPPWMKVLVRQDDDPLDVRLYGNGIINIIDLANLYSCSFIATDDIGMVTPAGNFEVQGRVDTSDIRGCNLLVAGW